MSMIVLDSEDSARRAAEMIQGPEGMRPETVTLESAEIREVVGNAQELVSEMTRRSGTTAGWASF